MCYSYLAEDNYIWYIRFIVIITVPVRSRSGFYFTIAKIEVVCNQIIAIDTLQKECKNKKTY